MLSTEFAVGDTGFHFGSEAQAAKRAEDKGKGRTIKAYLNIKKPINIDRDIMNWRANSTALMLWNINILNEEEYNMIESMSAQGFSYNSPAAVELRKILAEKGYDGIVYENDFEGEGKSYIAFYPEQVVIFDDGKNGTKFSLSEDEEIKGLSEEEQSLTTELSEMEQEYLIAQIEQGKKDAKVLRSEKDKLRKQIESLEKRSTRKAETQLKQYQRNLDKMVDRIAYKDEQLKALKQNKNDAVLAARIAEGRAWSEKYGNDMSELQEKISRKTPSLKPSAKDGMNCWPKRMRDSGNTRKQGASPYSGGR